MTRPENGFIREGQYLLHHHVVHGAERVPQHRGHHQSGPGPGTNGGAAAVVLVGLQVRAVGMKDALATHWVPFQCPKREDLLGQVSYIGVEGRQKGKASPPSSKQ